MPQYTNYYKNTAVPVNNNADGSLSSDDKRRRYFDNYYTKTTSVDPALFDIVSGFLEGRGYDKTTKDNLSITLLEIAKEQQVDPIELVKQLEIVPDKLKLNTLLCILMNTSRNRTSVLGFDHTKTINKNIKRTILA